MSIMNISFYAMSLRKTALARSIFIRSKNTRKGVPLIFGYKIERFHSFFHGPNSKQGAICSWHSIYAQIAKEKAKPIIGNPNAKQSLKKWK